jgi:hypothetical protein
MCYSWRTIWFLTDLQKLRLGYQDKVERPNEGRHTNESMERVDTCKKNACGVDALYGPHCCKNQWMTMMMMILSSYTSTETLDSTFSA